jgi:hypothetical protein
LPQSSRLATIGGKQFELTGQDDCLLAGQGETSESDLDKNDCRRGRGDFEEDLPSL